MVQAQIRYSHSCYKCSRAFEVKQEIKANPYMFCSSNCIWRFSYFIIETLDPELVVSWAKELLPKRALYTYDGNLLFDVTKEIIKKELYMNLLAHEPAQAHPLSQHRLKTPAHHPPYKGVSREPRAEPRSKSLSQENQELL